MEKDHKMVKAERSSKLELSQPVFENKGVQKKGVTYFAGVDWNNYMQLYAALIKLEMFF